MYIFTYLCVLLKEMIRKSLTIFFILIANIILLAHAVIPHHSHQNEVCVGNTHMQAQSGEHNSCSNHTHSQEQEAEDCDLNQAVVVLSQQLRSEIKCFDYATTYSQFDATQAVLLNKSFDALFYIDISNIKPPLLASIYSSFVGRQIGLRGPPVV